MITEIEKIAKTTTLAKQTIIKKEEKDSLEKAANLAKIAKVTRMFHCNKKNTLINITRIENFAKVPTCKEAR